MELEKLDQQQNAQSKEGERSYCNQEIEDSYCFCIFIAFVAIQ